MKILYIEDEEDLVALVRIACHDHCVSTARTLAEAKEMISQERFDVLLVDLNLPDSMGMATIKELKPFGLPVMVLTGVTSKDFVAQAVALGVADYMAKKDFTKTNLPLRLQFVHEKALKKARKSLLAFSRIDELKPYLTCAVLA